MPVIVKNYKLPHGDCEENLGFAFLCEYDENYHLKLKGNRKDNYFDGGDYSIAIEEAIKKFDRNIQKEYDQKNGGIWCLGVLDYFNKKLNGLYSIKFGDGSIFYVDELKKKEDE